MRNALLWLMTLLLLAACGRSPATVEPVINLSNLEPLPAGSTRETEPLRIAVAAMISRKGTVESYQPVLAYVAARLGRPVELIQRRTYAEVNDLVESGFVDVAFVCTSAYLGGRQKFGMELLVAPEVKGAAVYHSVLLVPANSHARSMADLHGKVFAFTDPMSHTGRVYPTFLVQQMDTTVESFFARTFFTHSHDDAIRAVARGVADGAAVDEIVYDFAVERDVSLRDKTRIIHRSPPFGMPPVVVGPNIRPQLKAELRHLLLNMASDDEGKAVLQNFGIERFVPSSDRAYDSARALLSAVGPAAQ